MTQPANKRLVTEAAQAAALAALGTAASKNVGTTTGTVAAGDDSRFGAALKVGGYTTPETFGAVGDGTTDDTTALLAAIATGLPMVLGAKTYLTGPLVATNIRGQGRGVSILKAKASITAHLVQTPAWAASYGTAAWGGDNAVHFSNFTIDVNRTAQAAPLVSQVGPTVTATPSTTGGTLAANTYGYLVAAKTTFGYGGVGARVQATTTGTTGKVALSWTAVTGATGYVIYGRTAYGESKLAEQTGTTYTDTGSASPGNYLPKHGNNTAAAGIAMYPRAAHLSGVEVLNAAGCGIVSEWAGDNPDGLPMESHLSDVVVYGAGTHSVYWDGPHDSVWEDCIFAMPSVGVGDVGIQDNVLIEAGPVAASNCHAWGQGRWAWNILNQSTLTNCQGEGGRAGQMRLYSPFIAVNGGWLFSPQSSTSVGIAIGDADYQGNHRVQVNGVYCYGFSSSSGPAIDVTYADGTSSVQAIINQTTGTRVKTGNNNLARLDIINTGTATPTPPQGLGVNAQTGTTYTLAMSDAGSVVELANAAAITLTVPPNSSVAYPLGTVIELDQTGAGQVTVAPGAGVTINNSSSLTTRAQWSAIRLRKRATDTWTLTGDLT